MKWRMGPCKVYIEALLVCSGRANPTETVPSVAHSAVVYLGASGVIVYGEGPSACSVACNCSLFSFHHGYIIPDGNFPNFEGV